MIVDYRFDFRICRSRKAQMTTGHLPPVRDRAEHLKLRENYESYLQAECESFDKSILQLAAAAIGVSIVFLHDIAKPPIEHPWLLGIAWASLVGSLLTVVSSYLLSHSILKRDILNLEHEQHREESEPPITVGFRHWHIRPRIRYFILTAGFLFVIGLIFLLMFGFVNLH